jgi:acyl carrier protein
MSQAMATELQNTNPSSIAPQSVASREREPGLDAALKRCSAATYRAAVRFRRTGNPEYLPAIVSGVIERFVDQTLRPKFDRADEDNLRLREDLGFDSLTMMEMLMLAEEVLQVSIDNAELRALQTVGDVKTLVVQMVPIKSHDQAS